MDWLSFITGIVGSLAWPSVAIFVLVFYREEVSKLLERVSVKKGDLSIELGREVDDINSRIAEAPPIKSVYELEPQITGKIPTASIEPVIIEAWQEFDGRLRELASANNIPISDSSPGSIVIRELMNKNIMDEDTGALILDLNGVRNKAVHYGLKNLSDDKKREFMVSTSATSAFLDSLITHPNKSE